MATKVVMQGLHGGTTDRTVSESVEEVAKLVNGASPDQPWFVLTNAQSGKEFGANAASILSFVEE